MDLPAHLPKPKLCSLRKWETFAGYGFNLHSDKGKPGQFVGKVDPNSPSSHGGLNALDVLIEVNGINVEEASHAIAVGRVKSIPDRVELFVCDPETYKYCRENFIKLSSTMHNIDEFETPATQPPPSQAAAPAAEKKSTIPPPPTGYEIQEVKPDALPEKFQPPQARQPETPVATAAAAAASSGAGGNGNGASRAAQRESSPASPAYKAATAAAPAGPPAGAGPTKKVAGDPLGNVSLDDVRARIGQNRRTQVKQMGNSFSEKYDMFEAL